MPRLIRIYIASVLWGICLAAVFTGLLIALDVAGLRHLLMQNSAGHLAIVMLVVFNSIVFSSVQFGFRIMTMHDKTPPPSGKRSHTILTQKLILAPETRR
ncbi:hypothetical protein [Paracoccus seriniphilus]|uniref:hypothetical protein n=1 Tax=Paracoccus seriniphilus TaxID=184748 RepID=UPI00356B5C5D